MTHTPTNNQDIPTSALILHPYEKKQAYSAGTLQDNLDEAEGLAKAIDLTISASMLIPLSSIRPGTYIGMGKIEELAALIQEKHITLTIVNTRISPIQQRNLEKTLKCKVIDRTALILEIFGERAQTKEGTLQVELAALEYQKSRLVRSWTHLERQRGGLGFVGGPGETQIEADRRIINDRITKIKKQLDTVTRTRTLHRASRQKVPYPIVALVGYTNAGKSTLFNMLTGADVMAKDMLFATLDPTMRAIKLPSGKQIMLSDTVGFISELPTELIAAFRATLEEVVEADIILHVRDIAHHDTQHQKENVLAILSELVPAHTLDNCMLEVQNKIDLLSANDRTARIKRAANDPTILPISALTQEGVDQLLAFIDEKLHEDAHQLTLTVPPHEGKLLAWLYQHTQVLERQDDEEQLRLTVLADTKHKAQLEKEFGIRV